MEHDEHWAHGIRREAGRAGRRLRVLARTWTRWGARKGLPALRTAAGRTTRSAHAACATCAGAARRLEACLPGRLGRWHPGRHRRALLWAGLAILLIVIVAALAGGGSGGGHRSTFSTYDRTGVQVYPNGALSHDGGSATWGGG